MEQDSGIEITSLMVDGGATNNNYLMQFQSDILGAEVDRPAITESTALGAAYLAGLHAGVWTLDEIKKVRKTDRKFAPGITKTERDHLYKGWQKAVQRTFDWAKDL